MNSSKVFAGIGLGFFAVIGILVVGALLSAFIHPQIGAIFFFSTVVAGIFLAVAKLLKVYKGQ